MFKVLAKTSSYDAQAFILVSPKNTNSPFCLYPKEWESLYAFELDQRKSSGNYFTDSCTGFCVFYQIYKKFPTLTDLPTVKAFHQKYSKYPDTTKDILIQWIRNRDGDQAILNFINFQISNEAKKHGSICLFMKFNNQGHTILIIKNGDNFRIADSNFYPYLAQIPNEESSLVGYTLSHLQLKLLELIKMLKDKIFCAPQVPGSLTKLSIANFS